VQINLVAETFVTRFKETIGKLSQRNEARLLLAVSGGPDSLALMLLANAAMPDRIAAATVDHGLRPEAAAEADYVAALCAERAIPHSILRPEHPIIGNIQSEARRTRYALLEQAADEADCSLIATAHHADDQLETVLMRFARGSGVDGMSGVRPRNGRIIRPLLEFSKSELEEICKFAGIQPVLDPSNDDAEFDRVAMRQWLARTQHPFNSARATRTATAMQDAGAALLWMTDQLASTRIKKIDDEIQCTAADLPHELQRRLVLTSLAMLDPDLNPRGDTVERLVDDLRGGRTTTVGDILCKGSDVWRFSPAPPRRNG
jgi:tRNA(Ile)-lysidine synthase